MANSQLVFPKQGNPLSYSQSNDLFVFLLCLLIKKKTKTKNPSSWQESAPKHFYFGAV